MEDLEFYDLFRLHDNSLTIVSWSFMIIGSIFLLLNNWFGIFYFLFGGLVASADWFKKNKILNRRVNILNKEIIRYNEKRKRT